MSEVESQENTVEKFIRTIKTFALRAGRMSDTDRKNYEELNQVYCIPFEHKTLNYSDIFQNNNPVTLEIGFGMGHATLKIAQDNPEKNYLGLEVHVPGVARVLTNIKKLSLKNLFLVQHDAVEVLETMIPDNSLDAIHIFFPDPWPKKKHHKRRFITRPRTDLLMKKLAPGGYLYFVTDWEEYAFHAKEELDLTEGFQNKYEDFAPHQEWRPRTKFEQKGLDANRQIYELFYLKK